MKTILERLTMKPDEMTKTKKRDLSVFLSLKSEIAQAIYHGWSARSIWELLKSEKKLTCGYVSFTKTCKRHGLTKNELTPEKLSLLLQNRKNISSSSAGTTPPPSDYSKPSEPALKEFKYNPNADTRGLI